ncbi:hypothetical protein ACFCVO_18165 [Agromyces sp. NPDC056379]|uniref:hypothetical protein n=1 Tax=unclassified Agromyces TaxID=2639701 RepID=UPI0035D87C26
MSVKHNVLERAAHEPPPKKRSAAGDRVAGLILGIVVLLGLGAGAAFALGVVSAPESVAPAADVTPTPAPSAPTPTPSEYAVSSGQPAPRYDLSCETLVDGALVTDLFAGDVSPTDPIVTESGVGIGIPTHSSVLAVGGTVCEWSNGIAMDSMQAAWNSEYAGLMVSVVPRPLAGWSEAAAAYGQPADQNFCNESSCIGTAVLGDAWVTVTAEGGDSNALHASAWQPVVDAIMSSVAAAGPAAPPSSPEQTSMTTVEDCEGILPLDSARSITGASDAVTWPKGPHGNWSSTDEARRTAGNAGCRWLIPETEAGVADVDWLRGGHWAFERMLLAGTSSRVELVGNRPDDAAAIRCDDALDGSCAVDLRIDQDWLTVGASDRDTAIALAEAVLAQRSNR